MKKQIIIVGGGNCGWITALFVRNMFPREQYNISIIASEDIGTIGIGESTIPYVVEFLRNLGISPTDIIRHCEATLKVGVQFGDCRKDHNFIHPFTTGVGSLSIKGKPLSYWYSLWGKKRFNDEIDIANTLIRENKVPFDIYGKLHHEYAYHIDAHLLGEYIKNICIQKYDITHINDTVISIEKNGKNISQIRTKNQVFDTPYMVFDCSGFHELCIKNFSSESPYKTFSEVLPCDRALVVQSNTNYQLRSYTLSKSMKYGWRWEIPLQSRMGNGYVFSSKYCSESEARQEFSSEIGVREEDFKMIHFKCGYHKKSWVGNIIALGSAYGFVETLKGTGIYLFCKQLDDFQKHYDSQNIETYNTLMEQQMLEMRDFIFFHYYAAKNKKSNFWKDFSKVSLSESIQKNSRTLKKTFLTHTLIQSIISSKKRVMPEYS